MNRRGFTLIELLVVISIVSLLASVVLASLNVARDKGRVAAGQRFASSLYNALGSDAVGIWSFDEATGTIAYDGSNRGDNASIIEAAHVAGVNGNALDFDGVNDYVSIPTAPPFPMTPNVFTVAAWINPSNQYSTFLTPQSNGVDQWLGFDPTAQALQVQITEFADTNNRSRSSTGGSIPIGKWTHFAVSINDKVIKIYINGALNAQYTETINIGDWTGQWIIGQRGIATNWLKGKLDDLRVYGAVLSDSQVHELYAEGAGSHPLARGGEAGVIK